MNVVIKDLEKLKNSIEFKSRCKLVYTNIKYSNDKTILCI